MKAWLDVQRRIHCGDRKLLDRVIKLHNCGWIAAQPALALQGAQVQGMSAADIAMWQIMRLGRAPDMQRSAKRVFRS